MLENEPEAGVGRGPSGLLPGGIVAFAGTDLSVFLERGNLDGAVASVSLKVSGMIGDGVLTAQLILNGSERIFDVLGLEGEKRPASSPIGKLLQGLIAPQDQAAVIGRDSVNNDLGALRHFDGLHSCNFALVVFSVADHDDGSPQGMLLLLLG